MHACVDLCALNVCMAWHGMVWYGMEGCTYAVYVCFHACVRMYVYVCMCVHVYVHVYAYMCVCVYVCMRVCVYVYVYVMLVWYGIDVHCDLM